MTAGAENTACWVRIKQDSSLEVEFYDFSETADEFLGGETVLFIGVTSESVPKIAKLLGVEGNSESDLLQAIGERFDSYSSISIWLNENRIKVKKWHDPFP